MRVKVGYKDELVVSVFHRSDLNAIALYYNMCLDLNVSKI